MRFLRQGMPIYWSPPTRNKSSRCRRMPNTDTLPEPGRSINSTTGNSSYITLRAETKHSIGGNQSTHSRPEFGNGVSAGVLAMNLLALIGLNILSVGR